jgi:branched-chain amino acid transport system permease protein
MIPQLIVSGMAVGVLYGIVGLGVVLIFKSTNILNFAHGELAMVSTFFTYTLLTTLSFPYPLAIVVALVFAGLIGFFVERFITRPFIGSAQMTVVIVTLGLFLLLGVVAMWIWGKDPLPFPPMIPDKPLKIKGIVFSSLNLLILFISCILMGGLYFFFRFTTMGIAMRAVADDMEGARLMGIGISRIFSLSWVLANMLGAISGILLAPIIYLDVNMMQVVILKSFVAAVLGGFTSMPGVMVGGILLGIMENFVGAYISSQFKNAFPFLIILLVLMVRPQGIFGKLRSKKV